MLICDLLGLSLSFKLEKINLSNIECCAPMYPSQLEKDELELGQLMPLTVMPNASGTYSLLAGDTMYAAMLEPKKNGRHYRQANCLVIDSASLSDTVRELLIECHRLELGYDNAEMHKLRIVELLLELANTENIKRSSLLSIISELFGQSTRYARMYITIASNGIPELREAVILPASGRREKSDHIPVQLAAQIANLTPEEQRAELKRLRTGAAPKESTTKPTNRKAVETWLRTLENLADSGEPLSAEDLSLLQKAEQLYQKTI